jgi:holliday junction DNA helicase RuvA
MIGRLRGELVYKRPPQLLLDVGGVGYELEAPMSTFYDLPAVGGSVILFTHLAVREDAQALYGFIREGERALFRTLLKVSGVGPRMALAILSGMDANRFAQCIEQEDEAALIRLPGIGRRTAQRLIIELRDRVNDLGTGLPLQGQSPMPPPGEDGPLADAISALVALGYKPPDANRMARAADDGAKTSEEIIRAALRSLSGP